ncbi:hypothetical protein Patl1_24745 [Pistacia atlantica]|uniref:Uncharacterized protein n=1 Tax=Pistacia atlantica TaxID=434234 RepID=A0ACC1B4C7_9ROSI|nr:hypothetical protein Patl1_24745 [Pistacia atlantica]
MDRFWFCVCVFACTNVVFSWEVAPEIKAVQEGDRAKAPPGTLTSVVFSWRVAPEIKAVQEGDRAKAPPGRTPNPT